MPNDECRLTYAEGNEIKKDAQKPYTRAAMMFLIMGLIAEAVLFGYLALDDYCHISDHDELDDLLDGGVITPELHEYLLHKERADSMAGAGFSHSR